MNRRAAAARTCATLIAVCASAAIAQPPCADPEYRHGISYVLPLRYQADFGHFAYANPQAPKGGSIRVPQMGTFDNYNAIVEIGRIAAGYGAMGSLVYDRLLEDSIDEPASAYVRLAAAVAVEQDYRWTAFRLRSDGRWHDGQPITVDDVLFTFDAIREHGSVALRTALADLAEIIVIGTNELCFVTRAGAQPKPDLAVHLPAASPSCRSTTGKGATSPRLQPSHPPASGPYRLRRAEFGRSLIYERVPEYWGQEHSRKQSRYNFDSVKFDYFRDENVMLEANKGDVVDVREESISKNWATQYDFRPCSEACSGPSCGSDAHLGPVVADLLELGSHNASKTSECAKRFGCCATSTSSIACISTTSTITA